MRKLLIKMVALVLGLTLLTGCGLNNTSDGVEKDSKVIRVGASPSPHAKILEKAAELLKELGYELKVVEYVDYIQPNVALANGDLDANYFQHQPFLDKFNKEKSETLVSVGAIHYEPFGIYAGKVSSIEELKENSKIAVPNDASNEARALLLLEAQGLIQLKEGAELTATKNDIVENPLNLDIVEIEAAQIPRSLSDVDLAVINGNYAIEAGLNVAKDAIVTEDAQSKAATTYGNIVAVKSGNEKKEGIVALVEVLKSTEMKEFIQSSFEGAVIPLEQEEAGKEEVKESETELLVVGEYKKITATKAYEKMQEVTKPMILDVRTKEEYAQGYIEGAILIPDDELQEKAEEILLDKEQTILVYCRSGRRSEIAANILNELGYVNVYDFGGIIDWPYEIVNE